jgi:nucleoside recognition protein
VVLAGSKAFLVLNDAVVKVLDSATAGKKFFFGRLALPSGTRNDAGEESLGFFLAFQALPTIIFFASLMALLYYADIMPRLIKLFSKVFTKLMRLSEVESLSVSSNYLCGCRSEHDSAALYRGHNAFRVLHNTFSRDVDDRIKRPGALCLPPSKTISDNSRPSCFGIRPVCDCSDRDVEDYYA